MFQRKMFFLLYNINCIKKSSANPIAPSQNRGEAFPIVSQFSFVSTITMLIARQIDNAMAKALKTFNGVALYFINVSL